jgi:NAD-dependent dihydropyrimidine dehydrogenase PreA subunit
MEVCPVDCIYEVWQDPEKPDQPLMVVIDPEECILCGACEPECPVEAIAIEEMVPDKWEPFIQINAMHTGRGDNDGPAEDRKMEHQDIAEEALKAHQSLHGA